MPFLLLGGSEMGHMKAEGHCGIVVYEDPIPQPWHLWRHLLGAPGFLHLIVHMSWRKGDRLFDWPQVMEPSCGP